MKSDRLSSCHSLALEIKWVDLDTDLLCCQVHQDMVYKDENPGMIFFIPEMLSLIPCTFILPRLDQSRERKRKHFNMNSLLHTSQNKE